MADEVRQGDDDGSTSVLSEGALRRGLLTPQELQNALQERARAASEGGEKTRRLRDFLVARGYLNENQVRALLEGSPPAPARSPVFPPGAPFGKYRILREVGRGGMGAVYEALDEALNRKVALKIMLPTPGVDEEEERFVREATFAARLKHPNVVTVYDSGVFQGHRYIAMEFVEGKPFSEWRRDPAVPLRRQVELLRDAALAVHQAHEHGILHRDLKPKNILVSAEGRAFVTDFGLAKMVGTDVSLTAPGTVVGTPAYMSPEQAKGVKTLDRRSDVYALGIMLYEMLAGRPPFQGDSAIEVLVKAVKDPAPAPSQFSSSVDGTLESICLKAVAKNPELRYATAEAFAADLSRWLAGEVFRSYRAARWTALLLVAGVAAVGLAAFLLFGPKPPPHPLSEEAWAASINLLPRVDPARDAVAGAWSRAEGGIYTDGGSPARLEIPYRPPAEYDFRVVFTRVGGTTCVNLILTRGGAGFALVLEPRGMFGFERVMGADYSRNPSLVRGAPMENGRTYDVVVEVRNDGVRAYLDGNPISAWKTDYSDVLMNPDWALRDPTLLGVGAWTSPTLFRKLQLREVRGKGAPARP